MTSQRIVLRAATPDDEPFVTEMARHASVIEDRPLPHPDDDEVREMLPPAGVAAIIAQDLNGTPVGAVWTYYGSPPLRCDAAGEPLPELCIAVAPGRRGVGIGGALMDASTSFAATVLANRSATPAAAASGSSPTTPTFWWAGTPPTRPPPPPPRPS